MDLRKKVLRMLPLIFFGSVYAYKLSLSFERTQDLDNFAFLGIAAIGLSCYAWIIHVDLDEFILTKEYVSFLPTFAGVVVIAFITALYSHHYNSINSPSLIKAFNEHEDGLEIDLKENGHYMLSKGNGRNQLYYYGKYTLQDSLINFDRPEVNKLIHSNQLVIKTVMDVSYQDNIEGLDTSYSDYLMHSDPKTSNNKEKYSYKVIEDHRMTNVMESAEK